MSTETPQISSLPELSKLSVLETQLVTEWLSNGQNGTKAYQTVRPNCSYDTARVESSEILQKAHVKAYIQAYKASIAPTSTLTKDKLIDHAQWGIEQARAKEELSAMFKGIEVGAKLINAYDTDSDDITKYTGLLAKITNSNVQINIGCKPERDLQVNNDDRG